jgi:hypothetical protein
LDLRAIISLNYEFEQRSRSGSCAILGIALNVFDGLFKIIKGVGKMQKSYNTTLKSLAYIGVVLMGAFSLNPIWADSQQITWTNGHSYQRFETSKISWTSAKDKCDSLGGYLATITGSEEQAFIANKILVLGGEPLKGYHIGGYKAADKNWHWITGEQWNYANWYQGHPFNVGIHLSIYNNRIWLDKDIVADIDGYICEWDYNQIISSAVVPDINNNGKPEIAGLYQSAKTKNYFIDMNDSLTHALVGKRLTFPLGKAPSGGMVVLKNIEKTNTTPEVGVLIYDGTKTYVQIKDVQKNVAIANISFLDSSYAPQAISAIPDINNNGYDEIIVSGKHKTAQDVIIEIRDSKTKKLLRIL